MLFNALHVFLIGLLGVVTSNSFLSGQDNPPGKTSIQDSRLIAAGETTRIHLRMTPDSGYWNNESATLIIWIEASEAGTPSDTRLVHPHVKSPSSHETRTLEFEFKTNSNLTENIKISGYALYYVCDSDDGQCIYRRQAISIPIQITSEN